MGYKQLDFRKRCQIYGLWRAGHSYTEIAKEVGVHKSTISRELKRNITFVRTALGSWQYKPNYAQSYTDERQKEKYKHVKFTKEVDSLFEKNYCRIGVQTKSAVMRNDAICFPLVMNGFINSY